MITCKCKVCGGEMELSGTSGFVCQYCGSKSFFTDADYRENEEFRKKLLLHYKAEAKNKEFDYGTDKLFSFSGRDSFLMADGQSLNVDYMKKYAYDGMTCYLAKESVVYVFDRETDVDAFRNGLDRLTFPAADDRLHRSFPELKLEIPLRSDRYALVFRRRPNLYPAEMFAPMDSVHLAWVISRMENICCALAFSGIEHGDISSTSVWINPVTHEGALFGDWRYVRDIRRTNDLYALRKTAIRIAKNTREPKELYTFLNSMPQADAFADFERWERVINEGFGGHHFVKMNIQ